jgi:hypothetical protein
MVKPRRLKFRGHVACTGEMAAQERHKFENNIKINLEELGWKKCGLHSFG